MTDAVEIDSVTKIYQIRETKEEETRKHRFGKLFLGESFRGKVEAIDKAVVDGVCLTVKEGDCIALLGPNGAGKTTLLEMVSTALSPNRGRIRIMGCDTVTERNQAKQFITPIFPMFGSHSRWTGRQNLEYTSLLYNFSKQEMTRRVNRALQLVGLAERADELVMRYSTGMKVRLTLANGFIIDNPIYLMDEPLVGIDPSTAKDIRKFIKAHLLAKGRTILLATHILEDVEALCNRIALMVNGRIVAVDTPSRLKQNVKGLESVTLEIIVPNGKHSEFLSHIFEGLELVKNVTFASELRDSKQIATFTIQTMDSRSLLPILIDEIHGRDSKVRHIHIAEPTLEDVFIAYTGKKLSE